MPKKTKTTAPKGASKTSRSEKHKSDDNHSGDHPQESKQDGITPELKSDEVEETKSSDKNSSSNDPPIDLGGGRTITLFDNSERPLRKSKRAKPRTKWKDNRREPKTPTPPPSPEESLDPNWAENLEDEISDEISTISVNSSPSFSEADSASENEEETSNDKKDDNGEGVPVNGDDTNLPPKSKTPNESSEYEKRNQLIKDEIVNAITNCFASQYESYADNIVKINWYSLREPDEEHAELFVHYYDHPTEESHGNQMRSIVTLAVGSRTFLDKVHPSRIARVLIAFLEQVRFFCLTDCCLQDFWSDLARTAFTTVCVLANASLRSPEDRRGVQHLMMRDTRGMDTTSKYLINPNWDEAVNQKHRPVSEKEADKLRGPHLPEWMRKESQVHNDLAFSEVRGKRSKRVNDSQLNISLGGTKGSQPSMLVSAAEMPTFTTFTPGRKDYEKLLAYVRLCESQDQDLRIEKWPEELVTNVTTQYRFTFCLDSQVDESGQPRQQEEWRTFNPSELRRSLERMAPGYKSHHSEDPFQDFFAWLNNYSLEVDWSRRGDPRVHPFFVASNGVATKFRRMRSALPLGKISPEQMKLLVKSLASSIKHKNVTETGEAKVRAELKSQLSKITDFEKTMEVIQDVVMKQYRRLEDAADFDTKTIAARDSSSAKRARDSDSSSVTSARKDLKRAKKKSKLIDEPSSKAAKQLAKQNKRCRGCGWNMRRNDAGKLCCPRNNKAGCGKDPRRNQSSLPWEESEVGRRWAAKDYPQGLPSDTSVTLQNAAERRKAYNAGITTCLAQHCKKLSLSRELIKFCVVDLQQNSDQSIVLTSNIKTKGGRAPTLPGKLLLDTGALGKCVVSSKFYNKLAKLDSLYEVFNVSNDLISALNKKVLTNKEILFNISLTNNSKQTIHIQVRAIVANINVDLILDRETIIANSLVYYYPSHFVGGDLLDIIKDLPPPVRDSDGRAARGKVSALDQKQKDIRHRKTSHRVWTQQNWKSLVPRHEVGNDPIQSSEVFTNSYSIYLASLASNFSRKPAFEREGNLTGIPDNKLESIPAELISDIADEAEYTKVKVEGPKLLQQHLRQLIRKYKDVFKSTVQATPAKIVPFKLEVDRDEWCSRKNQANIRSMDQERARALNEMLQILEDHDIIEPCDHGYYSQAFLVPKPSGAWRLVLDFKNLNKATLNQYRWPLPNIKEMLLRVGDTRPQFFAVFDLTSGYYQAPIDEDSRQYTAFATRRGIYQWRRLPMGLTGAGSYFQHSLSTQVLQGIIHHGVELYLDDCMVHASSMEEFLQRLEEVFERFRASGITLNPSKCKLGISQVEYVGHTIDKDGLHFTRSKLDSVLNFPKPQTKKHIKAFIGLANYFRDHIQLHSDRIQPLQQMVDDYEKRHAHHKVSWTHEAEAAFEDIRQAIDECPKLWFLDDYSPIFLRTDASNYGIGAYLYQRVEQPDGTTVEHPIGFISKSTASDHSSWDTPMKEGYAIFYALMKWEYLLRDRQFVIETDHQNLTRLRADHYDSNKMVKRWFMAYQEYDILDWVYRKGVDNEVPDSLSRLCPDVTEEHPAVHLFHLTGEKIPKDKWDIISQFHNSIERGHGGVQRTLNKLMEAGHTWSRMTGHVKRFIKNCACCQKMDQMKKVIHSYPFTTSSYGLWETVSVDYIESLKPDVYGNNMIIVIVDNFSRFTDLYAEKSTNAEGAADALLNFVGRYATPQSFCTDSGTSFKNAIVKGLTERLGADHHLTTAYSKEQNGLVERQNKEVLRHLRNIIHDRRVMHKWSKYLPIVQRIINTSVNSATGVSPADVVFPNGPTLDRSLITEANAIYISAYIRDMQEAQARIIALCEQNLREKDRRHMEEYSKERTVYADGSYVLAEHRHNSLRRGPKSKLAPFLRGPLLVRSHNDMGIYTVQDLVSQRIAEYHVSNLRPFHYDPETLNPIEEAVTDYPDEFIVQECLQMKGDPRKAKSQLFFKVRWAGYGPEDDTWEPWDHVRDNDMVHEFLYNHPSQRVRKLLPSSYIPLKEREPVVSDEEDNLSEEERSVSSS